MSLSRSTPSSRQALSLHTNTRTSTSKRDVNADFSIHTVSPLPLNVNTSSSQSRSPSDTLFLSHSVPGSHPACNLFPHVVSATSSFASISLDRVYLSMHHSKASKAYCNLCHCSFKPDDRTINAHLHGRQHTEHTRTVNKMQVTIIIKTTETSLLPSVPSVVSSAFRLQIGLVPILNFAVFFKYIVLALRNEQLQQQQIDQPSHASPNPLVNMLLNGPFELFQPHKLNVKYVDLTNQSRRRLHNSMDFRQMLGGKSSTSDAIQARKIVLEVTDWNHHVIRAMQQDQVKQIRKMESIAKTDSQGSSAARKKKNQTCDSTHAIDTIPRAEPDTSSLTSASSDSETSIPASIHRPSLSATALLDPLAQCSTRSTSPSTLSSDESSTVSVNDSKSSDDDDDIDSDASNASSQFASVKESEVQLQDRSSIECKFFSSDPALNRCNRNRCPFKHTEVAQMGIALPERCDSPPFADPVPFSFFSYFTEKAADSAPSSLVNNRTISWISNPFQLPALVSNDC